MTSVAETSQAPAREQQAPLALPLRSLAPHELGEIIVSTKKCDIHARNELEIIKLFGNGVARADVERAVRISTAIHDAGLAAAGVRPYLIECERRFGIVFDRAHGSTLLELNYRHPARIASLAALLAEQHRQVHRVRDARGLPAQKRILAEKLRRARPLSDKALAFLLALLDTLPEGTAVCHGDFHPGNVIVGADATVVIDWADATLGNHVCDVARTWMLLKFGGNNNWIARLYCELAAKFYARSYLRNSPVEKGEWANWKLVNMAVRLNEYLDPRERARTLAYLEGQLRRVIA